MTTQDTSTRRRVKLYALNADRQWDDRGTGHVTSNYVDRLKGKTARRWPRPTPRCVISFH